MAQMQPQEAIAKPASKTPLLVLTLQKVLNQRSPKWTFLLDFDHAAHTHTHMPGDDVSPVVMVWDLGQLLLCDNFNARGVTLVVMVWDLGQSLLCDNFNAHGVTPDGGFAEYVVYPPVGVGVLPLGTGPTRFILTQLLKLYSALRVAFDEAMKEFGVLPGICMQMYEVGWCVQNVVVVTAIKEYQDGSTMEDKSE
ncbi:hypothetical protein EDC04DRAFT_2601122 [Pisolithus marmoratus]|nr:hypothetical protein EDC04DRAFT_2601122 [Pisolithus marmoratus]